MDNREHPRIQLPFEVEVNHPSLGRVHCIARDISEGGMFVIMDTRGIRVGSKVKVTVIANSLAESTPTPTVSLEAVRLEEDGVALEFANRTSRHLWESVVRQRVELAVGRDYFQVYQAAVVVNRQGKLLVVQQHGKWLFPGSYLMVGQGWLDALETFMARELGLSDPAFRETLEVDSGTDVVAAERAMLSLFHRFYTDATRVKLKRNARYGKVKWVGRAMGIDELSFAHPLLRKVARRALDHAESEFETPPQGHRLPAGD